MNAAVPVAVAIGKAILVTLVHELGIDAVIAALFESHGEAAKEAILRGQYMTNDVLIEAEKEAKFGPRTPKNSG